MLGSVSLGGALRPFFRSLWRCPRICRSSVSTSAPHLAALARSIRRSMKFAVAHHVELEPEWRRGVGGDVLDRADAHRRQRERNAELLGGLAAEDLAVGVLHAGEAGGRERHRHADVDSNHARCGAAALHVDGDALAQLDLAEIAFVGAVGAFRPRARIGIVVEHARHALLRQHAQVLDRRDNHLVNRLCRQASARRAFPPTAAAPA